MLLTLKMARGQVIILIILLILWVVGVFLAGHYGHKFHDEQKKNTTNEILFIAGVVIAVGTFIGVIVVIIKMSRRGKSKAKVEDIPVESAAPVSWESYASSLPGNNLPYQPTSPVAMGASPYMSYGPPPLPPTLCAYPGQPSMYQPSASVYPYPY